MGHDTAVITYPSFFDSDEMRAADRIESDLGLSAGIEPDTAVFMQLVSAARALVDHLPRRFRRELRPVVDGVAPMGSLMAAMSYAMLTLDPKVLEDYVEWREIDASMLETGEATWGSADPGLQAAVERRSARDARLLLAVCRRLAQEVVLLAAWRSLLAATVVGPPSAPPVLVADLPTSRRSPLRRHAPPALDTSSIDMSIVALAA